MEGRKPSTISEDPGIKRIKNLEEPILAITEDQPLVVNRVHGHFSEVSCGISAGAIVDIY